MAVTLGWAGLQVKLAVDQLGNHVSRGVQYVLVSRDAFRGGGHWEWHHSAVPFEHVAVTTTVWILAFAQHQLAFDAVWDF